nr:hypothetical protein [Calothrix sp. PCC 7507]
MNGTSDISLMAERLESLKAGIIGALSLIFAFLITSLVNNLLLSRYFPILATEQISLVNLPWSFKIVASCIIPGFSGLLFGVTYRYIIRQDQNPQLKVGGVLAFGLVRGLTQIEFGWNSADTVVPYLLLAGESLLWFAIAAIALDFALHRRWLKAFSSV